MQNCSFTKSYTPNFSEDIFPVESVPGTYPKTYRVGQKERKFYRSELEPATSPGELGKDELNLYIESKKIKDVKKLRSQKSYAPEFIYLLRSKTDPSISKYISETELNKLLKDGYVSNIELGKIKETVS